MKRIAEYIVIIFTILIQSCFSQSYVMNQNVFSDGETLIYKVKWTFIRLGTITIKTISVPDDLDFVRISMQVQSNPTLFFISTNEYNETLVDIRNCMSKSYFGDHRNGGDRLLLHSSFDEASGSCVFREFDDVIKKNTKVDTIYNSPRYVDGPSLFFFTRAFSKSKIIHKVPTLINGEIKNTKLIFTDEKKEFEIDAFQFPVIAKKYYGIADWEGGTSQGLSGEFLGFITDDEAAIPVYAEVKVLLGKLKIELESYTRNNYHFKNQKLTNK
ncbi:MAG: DUF3108 domain-containing protein [Ignavibacterium sp.]|nr:DUF3108 domain-containing protein [Ignavibacterium sp.]MBS4034227.1 DUF3108 domain-containing protein [Ignavibacterium sp.]